MPSTKIRACGVDGENLIASGFGGQAPVCVLGSPEPQVTLLWGSFRKSKPITAGVAVVAVGKTHPIIDPGGLGVGGGVPKSAVFGAVSGFRAMVVEDNAEADLAGIGDDFIENCEGS